MNQQDPHEPNGEPLDFASLYVTHSRAIFYLALRMLGDHARAEDAVHDVFIKAYRNMAGFRHASEIRTWLYRIAINHCQNLLQRWHQRNVVSTGDALSLEDATQPEASPLRICEVKELGQRIQRTLDMLPEEYRLLLLLVADEELSYEQAATLTEQTADAVRGKLHRARKAFATAFAKTA